jgi:hypothetical protein
MDDSPKNGNVFSKPFVNIVLAALVGMTGATGVQLSLPTARSDSFTGKMALEMELRLMTAVDHRVNSHITRFSRHEMAMLKNEIMGAIKHLESNLPPQPLRERVISLEEFARRQEPNFAPPTRKWH